ncbi:SMI1/KNR4 family protein [Dactylosporangium sp. NPDC049140]|uniref:SMI1/KNR4 family protein n=1 Tax=Dactylosporangium sp. NPDC049140 TaxID=3155647 RepID=UPI003405E6A8
MGPPASGAELDLLRERLPWTPDELVALHRHVGPVTLPDIGNGYFLHAPDGVLAALDQQDRADQIGEPLAEHIDVVVFGSNGGGDLYAIAVTDGRVFRLQDASYIGGVYGGTNHGITVVAADLHDFLERFLNAVNAFAMNGDITDL